MVTTSSLAHRRGRIRWDDIDWQRRYSKWFAYAQSKLANLLFAFELQRRLAAAQAETVSVAAHPGYAATNLQAVGPQMAGSKVGGFLMALGNRIFAQSDEQGALPQLYAATAPDVVGGAFYGPDQMFEQRGAPKRVDSTKRSKNLDDAARLWARSEELTGVSFEAVLTPTP